MKFVIAAAAAALTMSASSAGLAADMGVMSNSEPMMMTDPGFDWDGMYVGVKGAATWFTPPAAINVGEVSFVLGANGTVDSVLFGLEGWIGGYSASTGLTGVLVGAEGRIGYLATPDVAIYGAADLQRYFGPGGFGMAGVGAGIEFAITNSLSLDVAYTNYFWNSVGSTANGHHVSAALNFHF